MHLALQNRGHTGPSRIIPKDVGEESVDPKVDENLALVDPKVDPTVDPKVDERSTTLTNKGGLNHHGHPHLSLQCRRSATISQKMEPREPRPRHRHRQAPQGGWTSQ